MKRLISELKKKGRVKRTSFVKSTRERDVRECLTLLQQSHPNIRKSLVEAEYHSREGKDGYPSTFYFLAISDITNSKRKTGGYKVYTINGRCGNPWSSFSRPQYTTYRGLLLAQKRFRVLSLAYKDSGYKKEWSLT